MLLENYKMNAFEAFSTFLFQAIYRSEDFPKVVKLFFNSYCIQSKGNIYMIKAIKNLIYYNRLLFRIIYFGEMSNLHNLRDLAFVHYCSLIHKSFYFPYCILYMIIKQSICTYFVMCKYLCRHCSNDKKLELHKFKYRN